MLMRPDLLTSDERSQIQAILDRLQQNRPPAKPEVLACHALEDALSGAMAIDSGSFGLAPGSLRDAARAVDTIVMKF
jgi:hypothetical protein